jgi:hypothetical protein
MYMNRKKKGVNKRGDNECDSILINAPEMGVHDFESHCGLHPDDRPLIRQLQNATSCYPASRVFGMVAHSASTQEES